MGWLQESLARLEVEEVARQQEAFKHQHEAAQVRRIAAQKKREEEQIRQLTREGIINKIHTDDFSLLSGLGVFDLLAEMQGTVWAGGSSVSFSTGNLSRSGYELGSFAGIEYRYEGMRDLTHLANKTHFTTHKPVKTIERSPVTDGVYIGIISQGENPDKLTRTLIVRSQKNSFHNTLVFSPDPRTYLGRFGDPKALSCVKTLLTKPIDLTDSAGLLSFRGEIQEMLAQDVFSRQQEHRLPYNIEKYHGASFWKLRKKRKV